MMQPQIFETPAGTLTVRNPVDEIPQMIALHRRCFPQMIESDEAWGEDQLRSHLEYFEEGQLVAELDGRIVGVASSLIVHLGHDPLRHHTYYGITDDGYFYNHDPQGDTLYGADVYVDPDCRGHGIGARSLYEARRDLCRRLNLRRILAGGRLWNYDELRRQTDTGGIRLAGPGRQDRRPGARLPAARRASSSAGSCRTTSATRAATTTPSLIEWLNPDYQVARRRRAQGARRLRPVPDAQDRRASTSSRARSATSSRRRARTTARSSCCSRSSSRCSCSVGARADGLAGGDPQAGGVHRRSSSS